MKDAEFVISQLSYLKTCLAELWVLQFKIRKYFGGFDSFSGLLTLNDGSPQSLILISFLSSKCKNVSFLIWERR